MAVSALPLMSIQYPILLLDIYFVWVGLLTDLGACFVRVWLIIVFLRIARALIVYRLEVELF